MQRILLLFCLLWASRFDLSVNEAGQSRTQYCTYSTDSRQHGTVSTQSAVLQKMLGCGWRQSVGVFGGYRYALEGQRRWRRFVRVGVNCSNGRAFTTGMVAWLRGGMCDFFGSRIIPLPYPPVYDYVLCVCMCCTVEVMHPVDTLSCT